MDFGFGNGLFSNMAEYTLTRCPLDVHVDLDDVAEWDESSQLVLGGPSFVSVKRPRLSNVFNVSEMCDFDKRDTESPSTAKIRFVTCRWTYIHAYREGEGAGI